MAAVAADYRDDQDVVIILMARGKSKFFQDDDFPMVRDVRNATSTLYGFGKSDQREEISVIDPDGKLVWQSHARMFDNMKREVEKVKPKAKGLLHGLDIPRQLRPMVLKDMRSGQLGTLETIAFKLSRKSSAKAFAKPLLDKIQADREARFEKIMGLLEAGNVAVGWPEAHAFLDAFPKSKEARDIRAAMKKLERDKQAKYEALAAKTFDQLVEMFGSDQGSKMKMAEQTLPVLASKFGDTHCGRLVKALWIDDNNALKK